MSTLHLVDTVTMNASYSYIKLQHSLYKFAPEKFIKFTPLENSNQEFSFLGPCKCCQLEIYGLHEDNCEWLRECTFLKTVDANGKPVMLHLFGQCTPLKTQMHRNQAAAEANLKLLGFEKFFDFYANLGNHMCPTVTLIWDPEFENFVQQWTPEFAKQFKFHKLYISGPESSK